MALSQPQIAVMLEGMLQQRREAFDKARAPMGCFSAALGFLLATGLAATGVVRLDAPIWLAAIVWVLTLALVLLIAAAASRVAADAVAQKVVAPFLVVFPVGSKEYDKALAILAAEQDDHALERRLLHILVGEEETKKVKPEVSSAAKKAATLKGAGLSSSQVNMLNDAGLLDDDAPLPKGPGAKPKPVDGLLGDFDKPAPKPATKVATVPPLKPESPAPAAKRPPPIPEEPPVIPLDPYSADKKGRR